MQSLHFPGSSRHELISFGFTCLSQFGVTSPVHYGAFVPARGSQVLASCSTIACPEGQAGRLSPHSLSKEVFAVAAAATSGLHVPAALPVCTDTCVNAVN